MFLDLQTVLAQNVDSWAFSFLVKYMGLSPSLPSHCLEEWGWPICGFYGGGKLNSVALR